MIVILDFDYTLFDTARFKEALFAALADCGPSRERWVETYEDVVGRDGGTTHDYDPDLQVELLRDELTCSDEEVGRRLDEAMVVARTCLYPGAADFLVGLRGLGYRLALLTLGNRQWQKRKIVASGVDRLVDEIHCVTGDKAAALRQLVVDGEAVACVNDNPTELAAMRAAVPWALCLLKLGPKGTLPEFADATCVDFTTLRQRLVEHAERQS